MDNRTAIEYKEFNNLNLRFESYTDMDLIGINSQNTIYKACEFEYAYLGSCKFIECNFVDSTFFHAGMASCDFYKCNMKECDMEQTYLNVSYLTESCFDNINITNGQLAGTILTDCSMKEANMKNIVAEEAIFDNCNLTGVDLSSSILTGADFTNSNLKGADLTNCNLENANFTNCNLENVKFLNCNLNNVTWDGVNIEDAEFDEGVKEEVFGIKYLDDNLYKQILDICNDGKFCVKIGRNNEAIDHYKKALELVPEPKDNWKATFWLYESIGDAYFYDFLYKECLEWMMQAFALPDGPEDPFVLLRIGECHYEMGNFEEAKKYLLEAHKYDVKNLMGMEDSKYFNLIKDLI